MDIIYERPPLPYLAALRAVARCCASTARLLRHHRLRLPAQWVGTLLHFADGTSARVYRETVADRGASVVLHGDVFDSPVRADLVARCVRWQLAKRRSGTHGSKDRAQVSGTGRKPWAQKGTGRARAGSLRAPPAARLTLASAAAPPAPCSRASRLYATPRFHQRRLMSRPPCPRPGQGPASGRCLRAPRSP